nr:MAG TPA: hypothetical protein [Caudoviricetes sp.]
MTIYPYYVRIIVGIYKLFKEEFVMIQWNLVCGWYVIRVDHKIVFQTKSKHLLLDHLKRISDYMRGVA